MIISVSGFINSGKDSVAKYLVEQHGFVRESWAGSVKDSLAVIFGWNREWLEGHTKESREWRESEDVWWSERLKRKITPRWAMQHYATEIMRDTFHDEIWTASLERKLLNTDSDVVISDTRFLNELNVVKRIGGITIRVIRGEQPSWIPTYLEHVANNSVDEFAKIYNIHSSEYSSVGLNYDYVLNNNGSLSDLYESVKNLLKDHRASK